MSAAKGAAHNAPGGDGFWSPICKATCANVYSCRGSVTFECMRVPTCPLTGKWCMQLTMPPITRPREVDFGPPIRKATCYLYNLPEVVSTFECMRVPTVSARFSTAPFFWNWAMIAVARLAPRGFLEDRAK